MTSAATATVRPIQNADQSVIVRIARQLVEDGDTYAFDPGISDDDLWAYWAPSAPGRGYVAIHNGAPVGMFVIRPNHPGPGAHIANASFAVDRAARGLKVGRTMGEAALNYARDLGYEAMQFNIVISTNTAALALWKSLGFAIVGTVPNGFRLPSGETVAFHILHRPL